MDTGKRAGGSRYCPHCKEPRDARRFAAHLARHEREHHDQQAARRAMESSRPSKRPRMEESLRGNDVPVNEANPEVVQSVDVAEPADPGIAPRVDTRVFPPDYDKPIGPSLPDTYIKIIPHPNAGEPVSIISLSHLTYEPNTSPSTPHQNSVPRQSLRPFAPFKTFADFDYARTAVNGQLGAPIVNHQLAGMHSSWAENTKITFRDYQDMKDALDNAAKFSGVMFHEGSIDVDFAGSTHTFKFDFRDPWHWIVNLVTDSSLAGASVWHSARKYFCHQGSEEQIVDEPNTASTWQEVDDQLAGDADGFTHCYLPLHIWLDKGLVTKGVKVHPIILRALWLPREIRNASGNGGGILIGYMPVVLDPRGKPEDLAFQKFRREVYQKILQYIFESCKKPSHHGEALRFGDGIDRVGHPGVLIESMDNEELWVFCGCRKGHNTFFPCPQCMAPRDKLHCITETFEPRDISAMRDLALAASAASSAAEKERLLQKASLHDVHLCFWDFRFSDPYRAASCDKLHDIDLGLWGKHIWPVLLNDLRRRNQTSNFVQYMRAFPRWRDLKHFNDVATIDFTDGRSYFDILMCILPCIVQLLPNASSLVYAIRALQEVRILNELRCTTTRRQAVLKKKTAEYEVACESVTKDEGKAFNFPKQHWVSHAVSDIEAKGTLDNMSTRPGEAFFQEAKQTYKHTNGKNTEHQMSTWDQYQEAIASITMTVDQADFEGAQPAAEDPGDDDASLEPLEQDEGEVPAHWIFGSRRKGENNATEMNSHAFGEYKSAVNSAYKGFDTLLRDVVAEVCPELGNAVVRDHDFRLMIRRFQTLHVNYQSLEDWTEATDILRCNPRFHDRSRYDGILINTGATSRPQIARLDELLRVVLRSGRQIDVAVVRLMEPTREWKPNTIWAGCQVFKEAKGITVVRMDSVVRGIVLAPAFGSKYKRANLYYPLDSIGGCDMYLRLNNIP